MRQVFAVVLAGGSGTRFWPASRRNAPKQLLAIGPSADLSLIGATVRRIEALCSKERTLVATGAHLVEATRRALPWLESKAFLGEPVARNTAACIGWATSIVARSDPDALVMVLPSDHHIGDEPAFHAALERALASAESAITTIGIEPSRPETGYGYIEAGEELAAGVRRVVRFVEKPDRARAESYLASGRHYWNSGMFFFRADEMLAAISEHLPELASGLERIERAAKAGGSAEQTETEAVFEALTSTSIDYGIMEKVAKLHVIPASFGWSDLGSWQSAWELSPKDEAGNSNTPDGILIDARSNLVRDLRTTGQSGRVIALVGVNDLCVVETDDALLVIPRDRAQDVRLIIEELARRGRRELL